MEHHGECAECDLSVQVLVVSGELSAAVCLGKRTVSTENYVTNQNKARSIFPTFVRFEVFEILRACQ